MGLDWGGSGADGGIILRALTPPLSGVGERGVRVKVSRRIRKDEEED